MYRNHLYQFHDTQTLECTTITETEDDDSSPLIEDTGYGAPYVPKLREVVSFINGGSHL